MTEQSEQSTQTEQSTQSEQSISEVTKPHSRCRRHWLAVLLGVVILLCGAVIGSAITLMVVHRVVVHAVEHPDEAAQRITHRLTRKLDLTEEQSARVLDILKERQKAIFAIRSRIQPEIAKELESTKEQVASVLNEEQARSWRERFDKLRKRWLPWLMPMFRPVPERS